MLNATDILQILTAFTGSVGFSLLFNVRVRFLGLAGLAGALGWTCFLLLRGPLGGDAQAYFVTAIICMAYAEILARLKRVPSTVFLVPAVIPLVPGASLYRSMRLALAGSWSEFSELILATVLLAAAIAAGVVCGMTLTCILTRLWGMVRRRRA